jgi:hypothetical protein
MHLLKVMYRGELTFHVEMLVTCHKTEQCHCSEDHSLNLHHCINLISDMHGSLTWLLIAKAPCWVVHKTAIYFTIKGRFIILGTMNCFFIYLISED